MTCVRCQTVPVFPEEGTLICYPASDMIQLGFLEGLKEWEAVIQEGEGGQLKVRYQTGELETMVQRLKENLDPKALKASRMGAFPSEENWSGFGILNAYEFVERASSPKFLSLIQRKAFQHVIQPIISVETETAFGYEFLMRALPDEPPFSPADLFAFSQRTGLQSALDSASRIRSIERSAGLVPNGIQRFINFLPSSIYDPRHCLKSTMKAAEENQVNPNDLIFEVVETERIEDLNHLKMILEYYKQEGMRVALDDIGSGYSTQALLKDLRPDFAKLDRALIQDCDESSEKQAYLKETIQFAKDLGIVVIAEGIERKEEYLICKELGADLVQGYYFGRPSPALWERKLECYS